MFSAGVNKAGSFLWYAALLYFSYLMLLITLQYVPARTDVAFLRIKEDVTGLLHYRIAFFAHVYSSMFVLVAGIIQFSGLLRSRYFKLHQWSGRIYVSIVILISGPSGLIMGYYGNGGLIARIAFCLLAVLWILFTYMGYTSAVSGHITAHKKWMYRSYALTLSAISLRLWKFILVYLFEPKPMDVYKVVSWLGWTGNLFIAELVIFFIITRNLKENQGYAGGRS